MNENFIAKVSIAIKASRHAVWQALISPDAIKEYMFGAASIQTGVKAARYRGKENGRENPMKTKVPFFK